MPILLLLLACASNIRSLYEADRDAALAPPSQASESWQPEVRVRLSQAALDEVVQATLDQGLLSWDRELKLAAPLGVTVTVHPQAQVDRLSLSASDSCEGCLDVDASLEGSARWSAAGVSGKVPFTAQLGATMSFALDHREDAWDVSGSLRDVRKVKVASARLGAVDATGLLGDWVEKGLERARHLALGTLGGAALPLRAARLSTDHGLLEIQLLTDVAGGSPVARGDALSEQWDLRIATPTVLALARRAAFQAGTLAYDTSPVPTSLSLDGQTFHMGLRLWRLSGAGWWRDYTVTGDVQVKAHKLALSPTDAREEEHSRGAGLADPLAALAEGRILDAVEGGLAQAFSAATGVALGERTLRAHVVAVAGQAEVLQLQGRLRLSDAATQADTPNEGGRSLGR